MNIPYDFTAITKAIAMDTKRKQWSLDCSDEGLETLRSQWVDEASIKSVEVASNQRELVKKIGETLAIFTLRRDT